jgi:Domain of unknown function (DUF4365)
MRKQRTRQHFIEDLGYNHVERQVLYSNCTLQKYQFDYGYDAMINMYSETGEYENEILQVQLKSTDFIKISDITNTIAFDLSKRDLELWLYSSSTVLIIIYDAIQEIAYWVDLINYFKINKKSLEKVNKFVRIYIPIENRFDKEAIQKIRTIKNNTHGDIENI